MSKCTNFLFFLACYPSFFITSSWFPSSNQHPLQLEQQDRQVLPRCAKDTKRGRRRCGSSSEFSKSQRHLEGWPGEWACSNKHFEPWLESLQVTCVQHFRIYKAIFIPCTSVHSHDNPMRQDLIFALKMRKPKLREFRWLSPDQLAESGMKFTTSD